MLAIADNLGATSSRRLWDLGWSCYRISGTLIALLLLCFATPVYANADSNSVAPLQQAFFEEIGIAIGDTVNGGIGVSGEQDIYTFTATIDQTIFFDLRASDLAAYVSLVDPNGLTIFDEWLADSGPYTLPQSGVYQLTIDGVDDAVGTYIFKLWNVPAPHQFAVAIGNTIFNGVPASGAGNIETPGVTDVYTFTATAGQGFFFDLREASLAAYASLEDPEGLTIFDEWINDTGPHILPLNGVYRLVIDGVGDATGTYNFKLWNVSPPHQFAIAIGDTIFNGVPRAGAGNIETPGVSDVYTFTAVAGQHIFFDLRSSALSAYVSLEDPEGLTIFDEWINDTGPHTLPLDGVYRLVVDGVGDATGVYNFKLWNVPPPHQFAITIGNIIDNGVPNAGAGNIETPGVHDVYTFSATAGQRLFFDLLVGEISAYVALEDPEGLIVFEEWIGDIGPYTLPLNGIYRLVVDGVGDATGVYKAKLVDLDAPVATPTSTPTPTPMPMATPTTTPTPSTPTEAATATPTATLAETATATATATPSVTATGVPTLPPSATNTTTPTLFPTPTATPSATATAITPTATPIGSGPAPVVISIDPNNGPDNQLTGVTIRGANFVGTPQVFLGDRAMSDVSRINAGQLLAQAPAGLPPGVYTVRVCNPDGQCGVLPNGYTVTGTGPTLTGIIPNQGYNDTPNEITLYGFNLQPGVIVMVGNVALNETVRINSTQVQAVVPAGLTAGTYDVTARNPASAVTATLAAAYMVLDPIGDDFSASDEDLWTTPLTIRQGETVLLGLNVHRQGGKTTRQVKVTFYQQAADGTRQEIGSVTTAPMAPGSEVVEAVFVEWNTTGLPSSVQVVAVIDPENQETETTKDNNSASRHFTLLPPAADTEPPTITLLQANGGAPQTTSAAISVTIEANDVGGNVVSMYLVEREFNSSARQWVAMQNTGWIPFQSPFAWTLTSRGGVRYIQAWVSDGAGNISEVTVKTRIDYNPPSDRVLAGQVRLYRRTVTAGQQVQVTLETLAGDADLYVWQPDGNQSWVSNLEGVTADTVTFTAPQSGDYQIEVFGYQASTYRLTISVGGAGQSRDTTTTMGYMAANKTPRSQPIIHPGNEPAGNAAVPVAPIIQQPTAARSLYMPLVVR